LGCGRIEQKLVGFYGGLRPRRSFGGSLEQRCRVGQPGGHPKCKASEPKRLRIVGALSKDGVEQLKRVWGFVQLLDEQRRHLTIHRRALGRRARPTCLAQRIKPAAQVPARDAQPRQRHVHVCTVRVDLRQPLIDLRSRLGVAEFPLFHAGPGQEHVGCVLSMGDLPLEEPPLALAPAFSVGVDVDQSLVGSDVVQMVVRLDQSLERRGCSSMARRTARERSGLGRHQITSLAGPETSRP
jgi:hypothetical protein